MSLSLNMCISVGQSKFTFQSRCRRLHCSKLRKLVDHRCVLWASRAAGLGFQLTLKLTPRDVTQPRLNQDAPFLYAAALECFYSLNEKISIFSSFQLDLFNVTFHFEERSVGGNIRASSLRKIVKSIELQIKVVNRYQEDVEELVDRLLVVAKSSWLLSLQPPQEATEYDAVMVCSRESYRIGLNKTASGAPLDDERVKLLFSNESQSAYAADLTSTVREDDAFASETREEITVDDYELVQETLKCPAVSFPLTSPMATAGRDRDPPDHSQHSHSQTADRPAVVTGRMLHSVDQDTGQVVVSLDTHTGTLHHKASGRTLSFQHVQLLQEDGVILVCSQQLYGSVSRPQPLVLHRLFSWHMIYVSVACQSLSVVCLFLVFFTYCVFGELRTLPGKNTLGLVTSLLLAMLLFEVRGWLE